MKNYINRLLVGVTMVVSAAALVSAFVGPAYASVPQATATSAVTEPTTGYYSYNFVAHEADAVNATSNTEGTSAAVDVNTDPKTDPLCVAKNKAEGTSLDCTMTFTHTLSTAEPVTAADVQEYTAQTGDKSLAVAASAPNPNYVLCKGWSQSEGSVLWREKHVGKMCYEHANTWVWTAPFPNPSRYKSGYHYCDRGWGIGYSIETKHCNVERVPDSHYYGGYFRRNWDIYQVHVVANGIAAYRSYDMHVNIFPSGAVTYHY